MKYLVIGLGNLGRAIAKDLTRVGNEVIGVAMSWRCSWGRWHVRRHPSIGRW